MSYNAKVYHAQGGDEMVVASGGTVTINSGGALNNAGTMAMVTGAAFTGPSGAKAAAIANVTGSGAFGTDAATTKAAINGVLALLRNLGALATS